MARFGLVGPSYTSQSIEADCQRCMNWYVEAIESQDGKSNAVLYQTPGAKIFTVLSGPAVRAQGTVNGRFFAISGTNFYEILSNGAQIIRGAVLDDSLPAFFAFSNLQILIVSGGAAYYFTLATNAFAQIDTTTGAAIQGPVSVCGYSDAYFIVLLKNSQKFQISALLDASLWDPLDIAQVSVFPDNIVSMIVDHREIWLLGLKASVVYYDSGNPNFPFEPVPGAFIEQGSAALASPVKLDNSIFWLGADERGNGVAWRANGYKPDRMSNHAVEFAWQGYSTIADVISYSYQDQGHAFWVLYFPTANKTWVFDVATGMWHERGFFQGQDYIAHRSRVHTFVFGKHLVGDWQTGIIFEMNINFVDDAGQPIRRSRRAPHLCIEEEWMFHHQLRVDVEVGLQSVDTRPVPGGPVFLADPLAGVWQLGVTDAGLLSTTLTTPQDPTLAAAAAAAVVTPPADPPPILSSPPPIPSPPPVTPEDLMDWWISPIANQHTEGVPPVNPIFSFRDPDGKKFWLMKNASGHPWDIEQFDGTYIYHWITENGDQPGNWANASAYKRFITKVPLTPRFLLLGTTQTITTLGNNPIERTVNCGADAQPLINIGDIKTITAGASSINFGGDVATRDAITVEYYYGGSAGNGIYPTRERYFLVKGLGLVQWDVASRQLDGSYVVGQVSPFNLIRNAAMPVPVFGCTAQPWWAI